MWWARESVWVESKSHEKPELKSIHPCEPPPILSHPIPSTMYISINQSMILVIIVWTIRTIRVFAFSNDWIIRAWKTPLKNDKYHTFEITFYYELNKPKKWKKNEKKVKKKKGKEQKNTHKNDWITFAFVFQRMKTNVMLNEHEFYVLC